MFSHENLIIYYHELQLKSDQMEVTQSAFDLSSYTAASSRLVSDLIITLGLPTRTRFKYVLLSYLRLLLEGKMYV